MIKTYIEIFLGLMILAAGLSLCPTDPIAIRDTILRAVAFPVQQICLHCLGKEPIHDFQFQVLGREQREEARLAQLRESAATEKMEKAAFVIFLKGEDLLNMMFDVHKEKEELLLKMPQAKGDSTEVKCFVPKSIFRNIGGVPDRVPWNPQTTLRARTQ